MSFHEFLEIYGCHYKVQKILNETRSGISSKQYSFLGGETGLQKDLRH